MAEQDLGQVVMQARTVARVARRVEASMRVLYERLGVLLDVHSTYVATMNGTPSTDEMHVTGLVADAIKFHAQAYAQLDLMGSTLSELDEVIRRLQEQA